MLSWSEYWNGDTPIYVSERHKIRHGECVARDIVGFIREPNWAVLDYGCGEARSADLVARNCAKLWLCDAAPSVLARVAARYKGEPRIAALSPEQLDAAIEPHSLDLVVANSLVQYLPAGELHHLLKRWRSKLKPGGRLVIGDVVSPDTRPARDARALLSFAVAHGFLLDALKGLARTAFSGYALTRAKLGLTTYSESAMIALLECEGYAAKRVRPNIGHNQARMTFVATTPA